MAIVYGSGFGMQELFKLLTAHLFLCITMHELKNFLGPFVLEASYDTRIFYYWVDGIRFTRS